MQHLAWRGLLDGGLKIRPMVLPDRFIDHDSPAKQIAEAGLDRRRTSSHTVLGALGVDTMRQRRVSGTDGRSDEPSIGTATLS